MKELSANKWATCIVHVRMTCAFILTAAILALWWYPKYDHPQHLLQDLAEEDQDKWEKVSKIKTTNSTEFLYVICLAPHCPPSRIPSPSRRHMLHSAPSLCFKSQSAREVKRAIDRNDVSDVLDWFSNLTKGIVTDNDYIIITHRSLFLYTNTDWQQQDALQHIVWSLNELELYFLAVLLMVSPLNKYYNESHCIPIDSPIPRFYCQFTRTFSNKNTHLHTRKDNTTNLPGEFGGISTIECIVHVHTPGVSPMEYSMQ